MWWACGAPGLGPRKPRTDEARHHASSVRGLTGGDSRKCSSRETVLLGVVVLLLLAACGGSAETPATETATTKTATTKTASTETASTETMPSVVPSSTVGPPETTYPIEVVQIAEANGVTPKEAAAILHRQGEQYDALIRITDLVGQDVIAGSAFHEDLRRADELTVFVVDEESVAVVRDRLVEAGLDPDKTAVEVAPEEEPDDPWDWLEREPHTGHDWLESPGPVILGAWTLVESNGVEPDAQLLAGFSSARWSLELCSSWLGRYLTSVEGNVTLTVDRENLQCEEAADVEQLLFRVLDDNEGEFAVAFEDDRMIWNGSASGSLVWQPDESIDRGTPPYPPDRSNVYEAWQQSPAPHMEGIWQLEEVGGEDPAAPVTLFVGVSTLGFEGQCNAMEGLFAVSSDSRLATNLYMTAAACGGPTGEVEEQMGQVLRENDGLQVSIEDETMIWAAESGAQMIWSR